MRVEAWAVNASPLILYARIGRLDLIERLAPAIMVPASVIDEVRGGVHKDRSAVEAIAWAIRFRVPDIEIPASVERWNLGAGESQVISCCLNGARWAVLDDQMARRCVRSLGLEMTGSLGIALRAKERGLVEVARPIVEGLVAEGMFVEVDLLERSLAAVGEGVGARREP